MSSPESLEEDDDVAADDWLEDNTDANPSECLEEVPISSKELFEEKFKAFDEEWQHLSTLKIVFDRWGWGA